MANSYQFNRGKPFYPIVMSYILQLHALTEIAVLGLPGIQRKLDLPTGQDSEELRASIEKLLGPLLLKVTGDSDPIDVHILKTASELVKNFSYLAQFQITAAFHCLVMAHEMTKDKPYRTFDPVWEFLRHCRNAVAHNGVFRFNSVEPQREAVWRGIAIEKRMEGEPLLKVSSGKGCLNLGDPIALLWDIEQAYPGMTV